MERKIREPGARHKPFGKDSRGRRGPLKPFCMQEAREV
jgi:hypothetical protein